MTCRRRWSCERLRTMRCSHRVGENPGGKAMPCDARPVYIVQEEGGPEKGVLRDGRVVSCRFVEDPGEATALGYVPHFATCTPSQEQPQSLYTQGNPYGYRLNLRHPLVEKLYYRYKERMGISRSTPLSDEERLDFEERVIPWLKEHSHEKGTT